MARLLLKSLLLLFLLAAPGANAGGANEKVILAMGDSLMAGYNLPPGASFPARLERWLVERGVAARVINAGVSGDTSSGGLARLEWTLSGLEGGEPDLLIIEFGGNDMLRGIDPSITRDNMDAMLKTLNERGIRTLVMGMRAAPNLGPEYAREFDAIFPDIASKYGTTLYPFYLEGVAGEPGLNLADGIHPNEQGINVIVEKTGPLILGLLEE